MEQQIHYYKQRTNILEKMGKSGISQVKDLINQGNFLNHEEIATKYKIKCNFLDSLQIRQSIPNGEAIYSITKTLL